MSANQIDPRSIKLGHQIEIDGEVFASKSLAIQALHDRGSSNSEIAKKLQIRYQFVYNVLKRTR